ncbi:Voltage-gated Ion Channel (VIC) Superfamily [Achlya hypogyna]|uniref:Voltage-gated Ion Channel (VIC) Superfamily n=1 Tax=Achlya hypogyna TaxID=1202772 RepID=A0A1V9YY44_ACHHY|nr:Voltage-gated Ion Channel (VIC) Superfamily [Achlya hypogyna]
MLQEALDRFTNASWVNGSFVPDLSTFVGTINATNTVISMPVEKACSILDSNPNCFTASWTLIWLQVKLWLLIQTPIFGVSVLFEWLDLAKNRHVEKARAFWDSSFAHALVRLPNAYGVQLVASLYSCSAWIVRASYLRVDPASWTLESLLMGFCAFNYILRWLGAKHKFYHVVRLTNLFDLLSIASHFSQSTTVTITDATAKERYSWLDMAFLRAYIIYYVVNALFRSYKSFHVQLIGFMIKAACLVFFAAAVLYSLERLGEIPGATSYFFHVYMCPTPAGDLVPSNNTDGYGAGLCTETMSLFTAFYFMLVTVSTVGYGDFTPKTVCGRVVVLFFIVTGIYTFAQETARLVAIYEDQRLGRTKYTLKRNVQHVVVTGNPSPVQIMDFIREFFHPDHEALFSTQQVPSAKTRRQPTQFHQQAHVVVLMEFQDEDVERDVQNTVQEYLASHPQYFGKVTLLAGSPLQDVDLKRAKVHDAMAVFFIPNKYATNANQEDAANVLRVLSVSNHKGDHTQLFAMLVNSENRVLLEATGIKSDHLVCSDEIKLGLMGLSCRCRGLSTLISNLIGSFDSAVAADADGPMPLWADEYVTGAGKEIYAIHLDPRYHGRTFTDVAVAIFQETQGQVLPIAIEDQRQVHCNPGHTQHISASSKVYVIADSMKDLVRYSAVGNLLRSKSTAAMLRARPNLVARAERARHNVEKAVPRSVRAYIDRLESIDEPPSPPPQLVHAGNHIIICSGVSLSGGHSVSRLVNFLRPLRKDHVSRPVPVVIVDPCSFTASSWAQLSVFGDVYHVQGSPQKHSILVRAGVYNASAIVVLDQGSEGHNDDSKAIFNAILIDAAIRDSNVFSIIELKDEHFNKFLDPLHRSGSFRSERAFSVGLPMLEMPARASVPERASVLSALPPRTLWSVPNWLQDRLEDARSGLRVLRNAFTGRVDAGDDDGDHDPLANRQMAALMRRFHMEDNDTFFQERFMCGTLFPGYVADELLIQSFFNPSINVFIQHVLDGTNVFALYDVPLAWRRLHLTYGELFLKMTTKQSYALPIGLLRAPSHMNGAEKAYVYTTPFAHAVVHPHDKIFVLINQHALHRLAQKLQRRFRTRRKARAAATAAP